MQRADQLETTFTRTVENVSFWRLGLAIYTLFVLSVGFLTNRARCSAPTVAQDVSSLMPFVALSILIYAFGSPLEERSSLYRAGFTAIAFGALPIVAWIAGFYYFSAGCLIDVG